MAPSSGRTYLLFPHYPALQPVAFHLYGTTPVETSLDSPCIKGYGSYPAFRFSANINNSSLNQSLGKNDRTGRDLSSTPKSNNISRIP